MEDLKKGTDHKGPAPKQAHPYLSRIKNTCLTVFFLSIVLIFVGQIRDNDRMLFVGLGMGVATTLVMLAENLEEEDRYGED
jgi:1,4-dihydroxy-2-naphthoate octaprenyltransferase